MKLTIAVTTDIAFDQRVKRIASSLVGQGWEVRVIGRRKKNTPQFDSPFTCEWISCFFNRSALFYAEYNLRLFFRLWHAPSDWICACDLDTLLGAGVAAKLRGKPLVFDAHEYFEESIEILDHKWIRKIWEWIARIGLPWTLDRYTVSNSLAAELKRKYGLEFKVIRNLAPVVQLALPKLREKYLWYQGAMNAGRGLDLLLEVIRELPGYRLQLAGDGDLTGHLQDRIRKEGLEQQVLLLGRLDYTSMMEKASQAFLGFDLLESGSKSYYWSLSNKTFDYMHAGLPSIQMDFPEYRSLHDRYPVGLLLADLNAESLLKAIRSFENAEFYASCQEACRRASMELNWENEAGILRSVYPSPG